MFGYLLFLFTIVPAIELALLIKVGQVIGVMDTLFLIIGTGLCGAYLARLQGFIIFQKIQLSLSRGEMPAEEMIDGLLVFCGGVLLITPGFITDMLGLSLLISPVRAILKHCLKRKFSQMMKESEMVYVDSSRHQPHQKHDDQTWEDADFHS